MQIGTLIRSFFVTGGPGGMLVLIAVTVALLVYWALARWIIRGSRADGLRELRASSQASHAAGDGEGGER